MVASPYRFRRSWRSVPKSAYWLQVLFPFSQLLDPDFLDRDIRLALCASEEQVFCHLDRGVLRFNDGRRPGSSPERPLKFCHD
jgi:hypothetical protein